MVISYQIVINDITFHITIFRTCLTDSSIYNFSNVGYEKIVTGTSIYVTLYKITDKKHMIHAHNDSVVFESREHKTRLNPYPVKDTPTVLRIMHRVTWFAQSQMNPCVEVRRRVTNTKM